MIHPYLSLEHPIRFAHRGSRVLWPENTAPAFQGAVDLGYRYLETDVRITRDRVVVVMHDATLERTTNGTGKVSDWRWEDLRNLDAAWHFDPAGGHPLRATGVGIMTLEDAFTTWPDVHFNIDLKSRGMEWAVAELIMRHDRVDSVLIGGFSDARIARFRRITQGRVATSAGPAASLAMWAAARVGRTIHRPVAAYQVPSEYRALPFDRKYVTAIQAAGAQVHVWTVNEPEEMHRILDLGADGIVTDRPDLLNDVMRARGQDV